jgi:hypothetical protein
VGVLRRGLLYAPQYTHSSQWRTDGEWGLENANAVKDYLEGKGWAGVEVVPVWSIEEMLADLDERPDNDMDMIGTVSHAGRGGPLFADSTKTRNTVQAGWSWFGFETPVSELENGGPVDIIGLGEVTTRIQRVLRPDGNVIFVGCKTGLVDEPGRSRYAPVTSAYAQGVPFFMPDSDPAKRYKTYVHAVADLTGRRVYGSKVRMTLGLAESVFKTIYYGGSAGTGAIPSFYISVLPGDAKADQLTGANMTYDAAEGAWSIEGDCDPWSGACDTEEARWDLEQ